MNLLYCELTTDGGNAGDDERDATWTYTARLDGVTVATGLSPEWGRNGPAQAASIGILRTTSTGHSLLMANERPVKINLFTL